MQTPGRQNEPQTPMIPVERRMDLAYDRLLAKATEETKNLERPQVRTLGRIINQLESMNLTMRGIREQIREDVRAKRRYYREEAKLLKKDSDNLGGVKNNLLRDIRSKGAAIAGGLGAAQLAAGNLGSGVQNLGLAGALMAPEIVEFLTGTVVNALAVKGLIGNRGVGGATNVVSNVGAASKLKNPLLITAALAASLLIPSLAKANQSGDNRRRELATKVIRGEQTINKPDVTRFRGQLNRFDRILSSMGFNRGQEQESRINPEEFIPQDNKDKRRELQPNKEEKKEGVGFFEGLKNLFSPKEENQEKIKKNIDQKVSMNQDSTNIFVEDTVEDNTTIQGDNLEVDNSLDIALTSKLIDNSIFNDQITNIFQSNEEMATDLLPNLSVAEMGKQVKTEVSNNIIDISSQNEQKIPSGFTGESVNTASVSVSTKFETGGGIIDKFEAASSLRSYGAFS